MGEEACRTALEKVLCNACGHVAEGKVLTLIVTGAGFDCGLNHWPALDAPGESQNISELQFPAPGKHLERPCDLQQRGQTTGCSSTEDGVISQQYGRCTAHFNASAHCPMLQVGSSSKDPL